jgi:hypothetical protein
MQQQFVLFFGDVLGLVSSMSPNERLFFFLALAAWVAERLT